MLEAIGHNEREFLKTPEIMFLPIDSHLSKFRWWIFGDKSIFSTEYFVSTACRLHAAYLLKSWNTVA